MSDQTLSNMRFRQDITVRYGETDKMGIVYHANYLIWFNEARDSMMRSWGLDVVSLEKSGLSFPIVEVSCKYISPARFGDVVSVFVIPIQEAAAKITFNYRVSIANGARLLATGRTTCVVLNAKQKMLLKMPPELLQVFEAQREMDAISGKRDQLCMKKQ